MAPHHGVLLVIGCNVNWLTLPTEMGPWVFEVKCIMSVCAALMVKGHCVATSAMFLKYLYLNL